MTETQVSIRISGELYAQVKKRAVLDERSVSQTIRYALRLYCDSACPIPEMEQQ